MKTETKPQETDKTQPLIYGPEVHAAWTMISRLAQRVREQKAQQQKAA
jgi:hypothetical protein